MINLAKIARKKLAFISSRDPKWGEIGIKGNGVDFRAILLSSRCLRLNLLSIEENFVGQIVHFSRTGGTAYKFD